MGWLLSLIFLLVGLFTNGSDLLQIGLLMTSGLFGISGSIGLVSDRLKTISEKKERKES